MARALRDQGSPFDALREAVLRGPVNASRRPRAAIDAAVRYLFDAVATSLQGSGRERYRIDELARETGIASRNIRAYQERGLLHAPRRSGRVAHYDDTHVTRLRMITSMLERGYTLAHIDEMLAAWHEGKDLAGILGLELVRPWAADKPAVMSLAGVTELAGDSNGLARLVADGLVELRETDALVHRPLLVQAIAETRNYGMSIDTVLAVHEQVAPLLDKVAAILVDAGSAHVAATKVAAGSDLFNEDAMTDFVAMLVRIRALASDSVRATLESAIERRIEASLGDYLARFADRRGSANDNAQLAGLEDR
ncbi:MerR family transcriptional regulator [Nocardia brasiliensis]